MKDDYSLSGDGSVTLVKKTDAQTDQIVKTNNDGSEKTDRKDNAKPVIKDIQKGILKDGMNLKTSNNLIRVNGTNADGSIQATTAGVESFALKLSNQISKEMGGSYLTNGGSETTAMTVGGYAVDPKKPNTLTSNNAFGAELGISENLSLSGYFHTHPTGMVGQRDPYTPSDEDKTIRDGVLQQRPKLFFNLITNPDDGGKIPFKLDYTHDPQ